MPDSEPKDPRELEALRMEAELLLSKKIDKLMAIVLQQVDIPVEELGSYFKKLDPKLLEIIKRPDFGNFLGFCLTPPLPHTLTEEELEILAPVDRATDDITEQIEESYDEQLPAEAILLRDKILVLRAQALLFIKHRMGDPVQAFAKHFAIDLADQSHQYDLAVPDNVKAILSEEEVAEALAGIDLINRMPEHEADKLVRKMKQDLSLPNEPMTFEEYTEQEQYEEALVKSLREIPKAIPDIREFARLVLNAESGLIHER